MGIRVHCALGPRRGYLLTCRWTFGVSSGVTGIKLPQTFKGKLCEGTFLGNGAAGCTVKLHVQDADALL